MSGDRFLDTNILVYAFDGTDDRKQKIAMAIVDREISARTFITSLQVLTEFVSVTTRKIPSKLTMDQAGQIVARFLQQRIIEPRKELLMLAMEMATRRSLSIWDAMVVAAARLAGCSVLLTEDMTHGTTIDGVRIENPFRTGAAPPQP